MENKLRRLLILAVLEAFIAAFSKGQGKFTTSLELYVVVSFWFGYGWVWFWFGYVRAAHAW